MLRKVLLLCGILSSLVYIAADIFAARRYPGYRYTAQTVSELSAIGAPTRPLLDDVRLLAAPAVPPKLGFHDECMRSDNIQFSLGFMKPSSQRPFGSYSSFGAPGSGGSLGFADPAAGIGYAYVTSRMGTALTGDPRDVALRQALYAALSVSPTLGRLAA